MVSLEAGLDKILQKWGHNIVLQRKTSEGFSRDLERHTVRHVYPSKSGIAGMLEEQMEGIIHVAERLYYMKGAVNPKEGDRLYDKEENLGETTWLIDYAFPQRGIAGKVVYWYVGATRENPE